MAFLTALATVLLATPFPQDPDWSKVPPPGQMIDVGGHRLHMRVAGHGGPTVVMEYGAGATSLDWALIQPEIAKFARIVTYDRAGYAWSDPGPLPRTMKQIAYELHLGLHRASLGPPYIMVGHSLGGPMVRTFAATYPKDVAGMVLFDTTDADTVLTVKGKNVRLRTLTKGRPVPPLTRKFYPGTKSPATSLEPFKSDPPFDRLPDSVQRLRAWLRQQPAFYEASDSEFDYLPEELTAMYHDQVKRSHPLGHIPLIVVAGLLREEKIPGEPVDPEWEGIWKEKVEQKRRQASLSSDGRFVVTSKSGHEIHIFQPDLAVQSVRDVVEAVRMHRKLNSKKS